MQSAKYPPNQFVLFLFSKAQHCGFPFPGLVVKFSVNELCLHSCYCSLRDKVQVEQLLRYIVEEAHEDAEKKRIFRYNKSN